MQIKEYRILFFALIVIFTAGDLVAQSEEEPLRFNYSVVVLGETYQQYESINQLNWMLRMSDEQIQPLSLRLDFPSNLRRYVGPPEMRFYEASKIEAGNEGAEALPPRLMCSVPIPAGNTRDLLIAIILPDKRKPLGIAVPLPEKMDTPGYAYTLNLSRKKIAAKINENKGFINPGEYFETDLNNIKNYKLRIDLAVDEGGQWQRMISNSTSASSQSRLLFLLYQSPSTGVWVQKKLALPAPKKEPEPNKEPETSEQ